MPSALGNDLREKTQQRLLGLDQPERERPFSSFLHSSQTEIRIGISTEEGEMSSLLLSIRVWNRESAHFMLAYNPGTSASNVMTPRSKCQDPKSSRLLSLSSQLYSTQTQHLALQSPLVATHPSAFLNLVPSLHH